MKSMFRIISQSEPVSISTHDGSSQKSTLVMQEIGGKYEDSYVVSMLGNQTRLCGGDIVWASLRFTARQYNGTNYQDITLQELIPITLH